MNVLKVLSPDFWEGVQFGILFSILEGGNEPVSESEAARMCGFRGSTAAKDFRNKFVFCEKPQINPIMIGIIPGRKKYHRKYYRQDVVNLINNNKLTLERSESWKTKQFLNRSLSLRQRKPERIK